MICSPHPLARLGLGLALLTCLAACAVVRPKAPEVSLQSIRLVEAGFSEQRFSLSLLVRNPNLREYVVTSITYEAEIGGRPFARGASKQRATLPGEGEARIEVPATTRTPGLLQGLIGGIDALLGDKAGQELEYRVFGTVEVEGLGPLPFDRRGRFRPAADRKPAAPEGRARVRAEILG